MTDDEFFALCDRLWNNGMDTSAPAAEIEGHCVWGCDLVLKHIAEADVKLQAAMSAARDLSLHRSEARRIVHQHLDDVMDLYVRAEKLERHANDGVAVLHKMGRRPKGRYNLDAQAALIKSWQRIQLVRNSAEIRNLLIH